MTQDDAARVDATAAADAIVRLVHGNHGGVGASPGDVDLVASSRHVSGPAKVLLLALLKEQTGTNGHLVPLAQSLIELQDPAPLSPGGDPPSLERGAEALLKSISDDPSRFPLGRSPAAFDPSIENMGFPWRPTTVLPAGLSYIPSVRHSLVSMKATCQASRHQSDGSPALYIETECYSKLPLESFEPLVNPHKWPECPMMHKEFTSMTAIADKPCRKLDAPDEGWQQVLRETVDIPSGPPHPVVTDLDFRLIRGDRYLGSTFEMVNSHHDDLTHDQGYLLAEDLGTVRRYTTLKAVWFADLAYDYPPATICPSWSLSSAILMYACLPNPEKESS